MPWILIALLALLSLTPAARSDTPPSRADGVYATLFNRAHPDNRLLRSRTAAGIAHPIPSCSPAAGSAPSARPAAIPKCTRVDPVQSDRLDADEVRRS
jgi:hypothetical protein